MIRDQSTSEGTLCPPNEPDVSLDVSTPEGDLRALLEARRQKPDGDLSYEEAKGYVDGLLPSEADYALLEQHLWVCEFCRGTIAELLRLGDGSTQRPRQFLERVERHQRLSGAAAAAAVTVRKRLHQYGGRLVYAQGDELVEELPDGSIRPFAPEGSEVSDQVEASEA